MLPLLCAFPNNPFHRTSPHCQSLPRHIHNCVSQNCSRFKRLKSVTPVSYTLPSISLTQLPSLYLLFILTRSTNLKTLSDFSQLALSVSCPSIHPYSPLTSSSSKPNILDTMGCVLASEHALPYHMLQPFEDTVTTTGMSFCLPYWVYCPVFGFLFSFFCFPNLCIMWEQKHVVFIFLYLWPSIITGT